MAEKLASMGVKAADVSPPSDRGGVPGKQQTGPARRARQAHHRSGKPDTRPEQRAGLILRWAAALALVLLPLAGGLAAKRYVVGASAVLPDDPFSRAHEGELVLASAKTVGGARVMFTEGRLVYLPPQTATASVMIPEAIDVAARARPFLTAMPDGTVLAVWEDADGLYSLARVRDAFPAIGPVSFRLEPAGTQTSMPSVLTAVAPLGPDAVLMGDITGRIWHVSLRASRESGTAAGGVLPVNSPDAALDGRVRQIFTAGDRFTAIGERGDRLKGRVSEGESVDVERLPASAALALVSAGPDQPGPPGSAFRDCGDCPEMVVVPAGSFRMGSPAGETGRVSDEGPQRTVRIDDPFAVGKYEVTWAEWEACVADGGCNGAGPEGDGGDNGWGKGSRPVIEVDWNDAQAYAQWLSRKTGERYRLLSEAEWEYVARAGTTGRFSWGDGDPTCSRGASNGANFLSCTSDRTEPVGYSAANAFGLHDLHGNVWEWTEDCYVDSYSGAPAYGSARIVSDCLQRVIRGGSWRSGPRVLRSADRNRRNPTYRYFWLGFRVARTF